MTQESFINYHLYQKYDVITHETKNKERDRR